MPIDPEKAVGYTFPSVSAQWGQDQVILYHLGIGAGVPATDPSELAYTYEKNLKVLPSFGVIPVLGGALAGLGQVPGLQFNFALLLHGEQDIEIHKPIPVAAKVQSVGKVAAIYDKKKAALVILEVETKDEKGEKLFTNRLSLFLRGEGGFGGDAGPKVGFEAPQREPDRVVETPILPQQALLYRLSGDKNPLHCDPDFAKLAGFDKPILHGLCSFGVACRAAVDHLLSGDTTKVARYRARFAGVAFPGETLVTSIWREGDQLLLQTQAKERNSPVITNAAIWVRR